MLRLNVDFLRFARLAMPAGILAGFVLTMLWRSGAAIGPLTFIALSVGSLVVIVAGELVLCWTGLSSVPMRVPVTTVTGTITTSLAVALGMLVTGLQLGTVFLCWSGIVVVVFMASRRRLSWLITKADAVDTLVLACLALLIAFWCRNAAAVLPILRATGVLPLWIDYYIHGAIVAQFGDPLAFGRGSIELAGAPLPIYHYGSYIVAAALASIVDLPGLGLAGAAQLPLGLFLAAVGSYALASVLADRRAGVLAIAFLILIPDASHYGLANGIFGFTWLLFTAPGSGYALGCAAIALVMAKLWLRDHQIGALVLTIALTVATFQLRAHIFLWLMPALALTLFCATDFAYRHRRKLLVATGAICVVGTVLLLTVPALQQLWLDRSAVVQFLWIVHQANEPLGYSGLYAWLVLSFGQTTAILLGTLLLVPAVLGIFTLGYPAALLLRLRRETWQPLDLFPLFLIAVFLLIVLFAPAGSNGDTTEYQHRAFVLLYQMIAIWTAAYVCRLLPARTAAASLRAVAAMAAVVVAALLVGSLTGFEPGRPKFAWGRDFFHVPIEPGLMEAAARVRSMAEPGDLIAAAPVNRQAHLVDSTLKLVSLTGIPAYLTRPAIYERSTPTVRRDIARERLARIAAIEASPDLTSALAALQRICITWYAEVGKDGPRFDPEHRGAAFVAGDVAVYRVPRPPTCPRRAP